MSAHLVLDALLLVLFLRRLHLAHHGLAGALHELLAGVLELLGERLERLRFLLVMALVHLGALGLACRLELVLARLLDAARLNLVVADLAVELDVGVRLDLALDLLLLARLELAAVALLGGLYQRRGHALLEGLLEVVEHHPIVVIGLVGFRDVVHVA